MDIEVSIKVKNEFDMVTDAKVSTENLDNALIIEGDTSELEEVLTHVKRAIVGLGYTEEMLRNHISPEGFVTDDGK